MLLLTTEVLPESCKIIEMYTMVQITKPVEISYKGILRRLLEKDKNEDKEALDLLVSLVPSEANAIIGIRATSSTQQFSDRTFLYLTYIGTPITYTSG